MIAAKTRRFTGPGIAVVVVDGMPQRIHPAAIVADFLTGGLNVTPPHEVDAVTCDLPWFGHTQEQHIQDITAFQKRW